jgi:hypothetical protein
MSALVNPPYMCATCKDHPAGVLVAGSYVPCLACMPLEHDARGLIVDNPRSAYELHPCGHYQLRGEIHHCPRGVSPGPAPSAR